MLIAGNLVVHSSEQHLDCGLGDFIIDDERLMGLPAGTHSGLFEIVRCLPQCYSKNNKGEMSTTFTVKIIATLGKFALLSTDPCHPTVKIDSNIVVEPSVFDANMPLINVDSESDAELFGALWPLQDVVKIDPTLNRVVFDKQRQRLKMLKYAFDCKTQTWHKSIA